jgi:hypothetical protein
MVKLRVMEMDRVMDMLLVILGVLVGVGVR